MQDKIPPAITLTNTALLKYTLFSLVFAIVILFTIILPAEYNIDPTGVGHKLGLTVFANIKENVKPNAKAETSASSQESSEKSKITTETITVTVPAGSGVEYKFIMAQYQKLEYEWLTDGSVLYFDLHGEPAGDTTGYFESYAIATLDEMKGSFTAPFSGSHGWYWKNTSDSPITVQLIVKGEYSKQGLK
ncbi:MAG: hypothetical protein COB83_01615 [Gammaproteobacteria bacterium]|nr:MAG: hypothetical protein COB83_01615 [Gammaproteobacteria bacterium]